MSEVIRMCGGAKCCPSIKEDWDKGIMYVVDGDQKIAFNEEQVKHLTKYLNER